MTLSRKTLLYTVLISVILIVFFTIYLVFLLPGLYVDHVNNQYIRQFEESHLTFLQEEDSAMPMSQSLRMIIPKEGEEIHLVSAFGEVVFRLADETLIAWVDQLKEELQSAEDTEDVRERVDRLLKTFESEAFRSLFAESIRALPMEILRVQRSSLDFSEEPGLVVARTVASKTRLMAFSGEFDSNTYINLIAFTERDEDVVVSFANVITGSIGQILPVSLQSLPMILLFALSIIIIGSYLFSEKIIRPITKVSSHARAMMQSKYEEMAPLELKTKDEISQLATDLDALYAQLRQQYHNLDQEHQRQQILLRSGSHQLKTPITSALLLVEGMMANVGKYADRETYFPKLRDQLIELQKMVEALLESQYNVQEMKREPVDIRAFITQHMSAYEQMAEQRNLSIELTGTLELVLDPKRLEIVIDSLLGNAVSYTEYGGKIRISLNGNIVVENSPARVDETVFDQALEPFVSSHLEPGRGLGLYTAKINAALLGLELRLERRGQTVTVTLHPVA